jgi:hypothetical protein
VSKMVSQNGQMIYEVASWCPQHGSFTDSFTSDIATNPTSRFHSAVSLQHFRNVCLNNSLFTICLISTPSSPRSSLVGKMAANMNDQELNEHLRSLVSLKTELEQRRYDKGGELATKTAARNTLRRVINAPNTPQETKIAMAPMFRAAQESVDELKAELDGLGQRIAAVTAEYQAAYAVYQSRPPAPSH